MYYDKVLRNSILICYFLFGILNIDLLNILEFIYLNLKMK